MTAILDPQTADRLAKLLGLLGSAHDGERAAAGAKADALVRERGLTWRQVIVPQNGSGTADHALWKFVASNRDLLTDWERDFIRCIGGRKSLSEKQWALLEQLAAKVRRAA
jgi:hypothetical protein